MIKDGEYQGVATMSRTNRGMLVQAVRGLTAGAFPINPPKAWFENPNFNKLTPLSITADGHVTGHIAAWHQSHIGMAGSIRPPKSKSNYGFFQTGQLETAEGELIDVGQITLSGGHAPLSASVPQVVKHYDDTESGVMDVCVYEDRYGILVAGALRPDVTPKQLRQLRASGVSGDWRPINNNLELIAVCAVNVPGFPIPRARIASGTPIALVAAGVEPLIDLIDRNAATTTVTESTEEPMSERERAGNRRSNAEVDPVLASLHSRLDRVEMALAGKVVEHRSQFDDAIVAAASQPKVTKTSPSVEELRSRVHAGKAAVAASAGVPPTVQAARLRRSVHRPQR